MLFSPLRKQLNALDLFDFVLRTEFTLSLPKGLG